MLTVTLTLLSALSLVLCQPVADKITSLPGYTGPLGNQWSGYINVGTSNGRYLHYWFVESFGNPKTDPVTVWMNGGPGCSSMDGLFYEMGPIHFQPSSNVVPVFNSNTWANISSMLFIEAPAGVGFSYSDNSNDYSTNDTRTAQDNYRLLLAFTKLFPAYAKHDLWIAGESYAGIYVPTLAEQVLNGVESGQFPMNFKGVLVGNGVTGSHDGRSVIDQNSFIYGHGLCSKPTWDQVVKDCTADPNGDTCNRDLRKAYTGLSGLNPYYIYGDCFSQRPTPEKFKLRKEMVDVPFARVPCIDSTHAHTYLNTPAVKQAIHVKTNIEWWICSNIVDYSSDYGSVLPIYHRLAKKGLKTLIYSGDADTVVDYTFSEYWTENLGFTPTSIWQAWSYSDSNGPQVGGYVTTYSEGLTFLTVLDSGHMVPQYKPYPAYTMFQRWISGAPMVDGLNN